MTGHFGSALKTGAAAQPQTGCQDGQTSQTDQIDQIGQTSHTGQTTHTDHTGQAGQTAELDQTGARQTAPAHARGKTVVIGSQGRMGAMLMQRAQAAGLDIAGADVPLTPEKLAHACAGAALAIICVPAAVFDEVTAALDPEMVREVLDVMLDLAKQGRTMIIVTHEMQFARAIANRVIFLDGGKIVEEAAPADFFDHPKTERAQRFLRTFTFDAVK